MRLRFGRKDRSEEAPAGEPAASAKVPPLAEVATGAGQAGQAEAPGAALSPAIESFKAASEAVKAREAARTPRQAH